ncbi:MAG: helix-turn-helix transcriptional regulator [Solirubrobacteraceae bacterium]
MERLRERELFDREREVRVLRHAIARASSGDGTLALVDGPAGIGKTALTAQALTAGTAAGLGVLRGRGARREAGFPFGVVRQLFEPHIAGLDDAARERAFEGAAQHAAVLFDTVDPEAAVPQDAGFTILHGLYWLVVNLARERPLLIAVDDAQWADPPSRRWIEHLARRLEGVAVTLLLAHRPGEVAAADDLARDLGREPTAVPLALGPLSPGATARLVRAAFDEEADDAFCAACHAATGGNPLLVRQTTGELARRGVSPAAATAGGMTDLMASAIAELVASRLRDVGTDGIELVAALCVIGQPADRLLTEQVARLRPEAAAAAIGRLQALDVVGAGPDLEFSHPLVHAAVEQHLGADLLAHAHRRAADVLAASGAGPDAIAPHLMLAPPTGDPRVVATLQAAAHAAAARGADDTARTMLERALAEPPAGAAAAAGVRHQLGIISAHSDMAAALPILTAALDATVDVRRRAQIAIDLAVPMLICLRARESVQRLDAAREALGPEDAAIAGALEATALSNAQWDLEMGDERAGRLERARRLDRPDTPVGRLVLLLGGVHDVMSSGVFGVDEVRAALDAGLIDDVGAHGPPFGLGCVTLALAGDLAGASRHAETAEREIARTGSPVAASHLANIRAALHLYRGALADAEAEAIHGLEAAVVPMGLPTLLASLVDALVARGELDRAWERLGEYGGHGTLPPLLGCLLLVGSRIRLREALGDHAGALADCDLAATWMRMAGATTTLPVFWQPHAAACHLALGDHTEARRLADEAIEVAERSGEPRARAIARIALARCTAGAERLDLLGTAATLAEEADARAILATARVARGKALHEAGRTAEARTVLRTGYEIAVRCGAVPVADQAHAELVAAGARPRRASPVGPAALTPAELRVARVAAAGRSNREAAEQLFVTVKTVEMHLSSTYRKLGIRSRSQLAIALDGVPAAARA